jgi:hypothetical protein
MSTNTEIIILIYLRFFIAYLLWNSLYDVFGKDSGF